MKVDFPGLEWRDLIRMRPLDGVVECLHPLPWLIGSWCFAEQATWFAALGCSFMFFLTALRLNHEAIHANRGFPAPAHRWVLHGLSALMLGSNSAVSWNHLRHHAHVGQADDLEGKCGQMTAAKVLGYGPLFPLEMHLEAWRRGGDRLRQRMSVDLGVNLLVVLIALRFSPTFLVYHLLAMTAAQCLTAFFAVWITHRGCDGDSLVARTQRSRAINFFSYNMFFHLEHHLFPQVPVRRLHVLASRIDAVRPGLAAEAKRVI